MIQAARSKVFVVSFILTDEDIVQAILKKVSELKGRVFVVTCLDDQRLRDGLAGEDDEIETSATRQMDCRKRLTEGGVWLRACGGCHAKYGLADDTVAVVSTSNFEERPLTQGGETGIRLTNSEEVEKIARHFTRLWHERCEWELPPGENHTVARRLSEQSPCRVIEPVWTQNSCAIWTDGEEHYILRQLQQVIESARKELLLATWDVIEVAKDPSLLIHPMKKAVERGVKIRMLARRRNPSQNSRDNMRVLANLGIELLGDKTNHAKGAIADGQTGLMFSANFDLNRGLTSGIEMGVILDHSKALDDFHRYLTFAMERASDVFVPSPTHADLNYRLFSNRKTSWPWEKSIIVTAEPECWNHFAEEVARGPVFFRMTNEEFSLLVLAGREEFILARDTSNNIVLLQGVRDRNHSGYGPFSKRADSLDAKSGYCPAVITCQP
ncbi:MAG: hypothetical protein JWM11_5623, partial [Planctomycetaceae bacterium]|nr:hypothetical protein [Planctomycetaceae bacterium]